MRRLGLGLALAALILLTQPQVGAAQETDQYATYLTEVNSYIAFYHRHLGKWVKKRVARLQKNIAPAVVRQSIAQGLDPLLVSLLISCESTWRPGVTGKDGEVGIMQVMEPRFQPETLEDEILLGTEKLQTAMNACPDVLGALTYYVSGYCNPRTERTKKRMKWRYKRYLEAVDHCRVATESAQ